MYAAIRGTQIYFDVEGVGLVPEGERMRERPVAMIVHGGPGSDHSGFKPVMSSLTDTMQLIYFDHRGQGRSGKAAPQTDPATFTLDQNVEDMEALRHYLGLGAVVCIGTSYGGMVAMAHASRYPASVSRLVLIVTASHGGFIPRAQEIVRQRGTLEQQRVCEKLWTGEFQAEAELREYYRVMGPLYSRRHEPAAAGSATARGIYTPEPLNRAFGPSGFLRTLDLRPELARVSAPTLVLAGRHDWICPVEFSEELHRLLPGSVLKVFEESSHSIRADQPQEMLTAIREFVSCPSLL
ncbi:MAG: alpha/beta fold hydrolase [Acetobacteraceae bacterium]|nr:alpha/beta fold hydrolase [Acetobacteraceae bacterium]